MKKEIRFILLVLFFCTTAFGDYLEVRRSATVKTQPERNAPVIEKLNRGDFIELLNNGQQENGYYKVRTKSVNQEGWIYRTLVRRHEGFIPEAAETTTFSLYYGAIPQDYYSDAVNLDGDALKAALHNIIKEHREFSYGSVWDILKETDIDTLNTSHVIGLYSGFSMDADLEYDGGKGWNREHVWAKSRGDFGTSQGAGTDLHHLRVADVSTNSARNNRSFDECDIPYFDESGKYQGQTQSFTGETTWTWEPRDKVKGDVARMLLYMVVRYEGEDDEPDLELTDSVPAKDSKSSEIGVLSTLLKWHKQDPVDNYEKYRNHIIYEKYQHNRNPFIDHPEFVSKIWGN